MYKKSSDVGLKRLMIFFLLTVVHSTRPTKNNFVLFAVGFAAAFNLVHMKLSSIPPFSETRSNHLCHDAALSAA